MAQIRQHTDERIKRHKARFCIQNSVSNVIFIRIMACESPKQPWDKLKEEFQGTERTRQQKLLNLRREFENLKMKEEETMKQYSDRIMAIVNNIRLLGDQFSEAKIVEKVISTFPERYEAKISSLEDSRDLTSIFLTELINTLYDQEQIRASRQDEHQEGKKARSDKSRRDEARRRNKGKLRQNQPQQSRAEAQVVEEGNGQEEQVFAVSCSAAKRKATKRRLIDSGYTNHMTPNDAIFKNIDRSFKTKVKVRNGHFIKVEGKGDVLIGILTGNKLVTIVLFAPEIDKNLLSIAQLLEKGYSVVFKGK
ncbi:uncharacterized protein LOC105766928 [Gossypium raimondii]|uniref:uncharacterized protein LOC105766928 n=1 Tax=Gossypium raimondii TaxID=29730 RepID=UPI00063AB641|nr:uncharacterized protein LOC105766928 [Gossypium raimondii]